MEYILKNDDLEVKFTAFGGTLTSIKDNYGIEYLWQGNKEYWSGQAPVLFPICGSIRDDKAVIGENKTTAMPRHGIVRKKDFKFVDKTDSSITFLIENDEEMLKQFPYEFKLYTKYTLNGKSIDITYEVENTGSEVMPFFVGGHPGFNCPLVEGEKYEDYVITFEENETLNVPTPVTKTGLIDVEHRTKFLDNEKEVKLNHEMFEVDAVIIDDLKSRKLTFSSKKSGKGIAMEFEQFPYLILWSSSNHGEFVAIEPRVGLSTCSDESDVFEEKRNVQFVEGGSSKSYTFTISVL